MSDENFFLDVFSYFVTSSLMRSTTSSGTSFFKSIPLTSAPTTGSGFKEYCDEAETVVILLILDKPNINKLFIRAYCKSLQPNVCYFKVYCVIILRKAMTH